MTQNPTTLYPGVWTYVCIKTPLWPPLKKQEEAWNKVKNEELNVLQGGQQCTWEPASLRYKQIMNSNISDTQHKQLQAQGYSIYGSICFGKHEWTLYPNIKPQHVIVFFFFFFFLFPPSRSERPARKDAGSRVLDRAAASATDLFATLERERSDATSSWSDRSDRSPWTGRSGCRSGAGGAAGGRGGAWRRPRRELQSMIQVHKQRDELLALIQKTVWLATFVIPKKRKRETTDRDCKCNSEIKSIKNFKKKQKKTQHRAT